MKKISSIFAIIFLMVQCKEKKNTASYHQGSLVVATDEAFKGVVEALAEGYMMNYPDTKIQVKVEKEDLALMDLIQGKETAIVMSRSLRPNEIQAYKDQINSLPQPAKFAADAVLFVVAKDSPIEALSFEEIKMGLQSTQKKFIFDNTNASNLNFVAEKIQIQPKKLNFSVIRGNENLIHQISSLKSKIGVISLSTISRPYDPKSTALRNQIKILPIKHQGKTYTASLDQLREMKYPFTRVMYFLTNEGGFNLANGMIRFSCTQIGQMIVEKEGIQPYNLYKREVQMK